MSRLAVLAALLAAVPAASAQGAPSAPAPHDRAPTRGERTVVGLASLAGGVAVPLVLWVGSTDSWGSDGRRVFLLSTATVGLAAGTMAGADLLGLRSPAFGEALGDAALGYVVGGGAAILVGGAVGYGLHYATGQGDYDFISPAVGGAVGLAVGVPILLTLTTRSVEAGPAAFRAPTGEAGAGLTLRVGL